jgi:hypothetical protein
MASSGCYFAAACYGTVNARIRSELSKNPVMLSHREISLSLLFFGSCLTLSRTDREVQSGLAPIN